MPRYEFSFDATPDLGPKAIRCLLWKRGGVVGPIALIMLPILLAIVARDPGYRVITGVLAGASIMLLVIFLLIVWQRRRVYRRFLRTAASPEFRIAMDDDGVAIATAMGSSIVPWQTFERLLQCRGVALLMYSGSYIAIPTSAVPEGALMYAEERIRASRRS